MNFLKKSVYFFIFLASCCSYAQTVRVIDNKGTIQNVDISKWSTSGSNISNKNVGSIGIGTASPDTSAKLDVSSTTGGFLPPRLTTAERNAIVSPAVGLVIFNLTSNALEINKGTTSAPVWTSSFTPDATSSEKGILILTGDLGGTAGSPTVPGLAFKAPLDSPSLTGTPLAPTAATGTNTTQIAITAFVTTAVAAATIVDASTTVKGKIQLGGDLGGSNDAANPTITTGAVSTTKLADNAVTTIKITNANVTTAKLADNAVTNAKIGEIVSVEKGGTGSNMSSSIGYVKQAAAGANFTTVAKVPLVDVDGAVQTVNGSAPDANGNVSVTFGTVFTGTLANRATVVSSPNNGDIYVVSSDPTASNNGITYIYDGSAWQEVTANQASLDARYLRLAGGTMAGNITIPADKKVILTSLPTSATDAANKAYVDSVVASGVSDASTSLKGKIKLAGDLAGTADEPTVPALTNKVEGSGTLNYISKFTATKTLGNSLLFDNGTNVGIGTTSPVTKLNIQGPTAVQAANASAGMIRMSRPSQSGVKWDNIAQFNLGTHYDSGNAMDAKSRLDLALTNGADNTTLTTTMTWLANGNVGIGTAAPSGGLTIFGVPNSGLTATISGKTDMTKEIIFGRGGGTKGFAAIAAVDQGNYGGGLAFFTKASNGSDNFPTGAIQAMNIDWLGNVGIGNTSPSAPLVVQGKTSGAGVFKLAAPSGSTAAGDNWWMGFNHGTTSTDATDRARIGVDIAAGGPGRLFFTTGAAASQTRAMFIDESQRVGIGTSTPTAQLEVATTNGLSALIRRGGASAQTPSNLILQKTSGANAGTHGAVVNGDYVGRILFSASNGSSYLTNGTDMVGYAAGTQSATNNGGGIFFRTVPQNSVAQSVERMRIDHNGNIGIGDFSATAPVSKLEVNGAATNTTAFNAAAGTSIDFSKSNLAYTTASPGAFTLTNLKDGGTYTLAVQGTTVGTAVFTATGFTFKSVNNAATIGGKQTLYTFIVMGTTVYYYMAAGF